MSHPFAALLGVTHVPHWSGPAAVYLLLDGPVSKPIGEPVAARPRACRRGKPRRWVPWTLMTPQREAEIAAGVWDMSNLWPFPEGSSA